MGTTQTTLFPPPLQNSGLKDSIGRYFLTLQSLLPLRVLDTSAGGYAETPPPAGLNASTGQSNQNQEIIYVKGSADANVFTLNGVQFGPYTLSAQGQFLRIKSDGTNWWRVG